MLLLASLYVGIILVLILEIDVSVLVHVVFPTSPLIIHVCHGEIIDTVWFSLVCYVLVSCFLGSSNIPFGFFFSFLLMGVSK